ncbi:MAG: hypothetical protein ACODAF_09770 [Actinomycetota bacterium]
MLINEALARAQCRERMRRAEHERVLQQYRSAARMRRKADRLQQKAERANQRAQSLSEAAAAANL